METNRWGGSVHYVKPFRKYIVSNLSQGKKKSVCQFFDVFDVIF